MLRDPHRRINTTSIGHAKSVAYQQRQWAPIITSFKAVLLHHLKVTFCDVGGSFPFRAAASEARLPAVEENATNDRLGVTRFVR